MGVSGQPQRFSPGERTPGTHCIGGWVGPRAGLDTEARGKTLLPLPGIERRSPGRPVCSQTLYWLSYPAHLLFMQHVLLIWKIKSVLCMFDYAWRYISKGKHRKIMLTKFIMIWAFLLISFTVILSVVTDGTCRTHLGYRDVCKI
jgi:hypothetical protein